MEKSVAWSSTPTSSDGSAESALGKRKARALSSSERGLRFRQRQREYQEALEASTRRLRLEIARLQAASDARRSSRTFSTGSSPMRFALEYFSQFRFGLARFSSVPASVTRTTEQTQDAFLEAMTEPGARMFGRPLVAAIKGALASKNRLHGAFRLVLETTELLTADGSAVVVSRGCNLLRYTRRTIEALYPHVLWNEPLVHKLVGRQVRVPFVMKMFFNEGGRLENIEVDADMVLALYEVLRDLDECVEVLGYAPVAKFVGRRGMDAQQPVAPLSALLAAANSPKSTTVTKPPLAPPPPPPMSQEIQTRSTTPRSISPDRPFMNMRYILS